MNTNEHKLFLGEEVRQIVGCAFEVLNTLGCGLLEKTAVFGNETPQYFGVWKVNSKYYRATKLTPEFLKPELPLSGRRLEYLDIEDLIKTKNFTAGLNVLIEQYLLKWEKNDDPKAQILLGSFYGEDEKRAK